MDAERYIAKPVTVEAIYLQRGNLKAVETFLAGKIMPDMYQAIGGWKINWGNSHVTINTIDGKRKAVPGNWIVKDSLGRFFVYRDDVFQSRYQQEAP